MVYVVHGSPTPAGVPQPQVVYGAPPITGRATIFTPPAPSLAYAPTRIFAPPLGPINSTVVAEVAAAAADVPGVLAHGGALPVASLVEDFTGTSLPWPWTGGVSGAGTFVINNDVEFTPDTAGATSNSVGTWNQFYDAYGGIVSVEVVQTLNNTLGCQTFLTLDYNGSGTNQFFIMVESGNIQFEQVVGGSYSTLASTTYSPTNHKFWRLRESERVMYAELSPDGVTWTLLGQTDSTVIRLDRLIIELTANTWQAVALPGTAIFDKLNITGTNDTVLGQPATGTAAVSLPRPRGGVLPIANLQEQFTGNTAAATWGIGGSAGGTYVYANNRAEITPDPAANGNGNLSSWNQYYDLYEGSIMAEIQSVPNQQSGQQTFFMVMDQGSALDQFYVKVENGTFTFTQQVAGVYTDIVSVAWDASYRWWRFRETAGVIYAETSPDGLTWTELGHTSSDPVRLDRVVIQFGVNAWKAITTPTGLFAVDNVNVLSVNATGIAASAGMTATALASTQATVRQVTDLPPAVAATAAALVTSQATTRNPTELPPAAAAAFDAPATVQAAQRQATDVPPTVAATVQALASVQTNQRQPTELPPAAAVAFDAAPSVQLTVRNPTELPPAATETADALPSTQLAQRSVVDAPPVTTAQAQALASTQVNQRQPTELPPVVTASADAASTTQATTRNPLELPPGAALSADALASVQSTTRNPTELPSVAPVTADAMPSVQLAQRQVTDVPPTVNATADIPLPNRSGGITANPSAADAAGAAMPSTQVTVRQDVVQVVTATVTADGRPSVQLAGTGDIVQAAAAAASVQGLAATQSATRNDVVAAAISAAVADVLAPVIGHTSVTTILATPANTNFDGPATVEVTSRQAVVLPPSAPVSIDALAGQIAAVRSAGINADIAAALATVGQITFSANRNATIVPPEANVASDALPSTQATVRHRTILAVDAQVGGAVLLVSVQPQRNVLELPTPAVAASGAVVPVISAETVATILALTAEAVADALASAQTTATNSIILAAIADALAELSQVHAFVGGGHAVMHGTGALSAAARQTTAYVARVRRGPATAGTHGERGR